MSTILRINLNPRAVTCRLCGEICDHQQGVPMWEGLLLSNSWEGNWNSQPSCRPCFERHARGELKTFDHVFATPVAPRTHASDQLEQRL